MALPFIVGPHQCSLSQGPDVRPQVEVVLRIRLPLAEFFDALLLSLADQRPLFQQEGHEPAPTPIAPVKAGLQTTGHRSPPLKEEASPKRKTTGRTQPKRPVHPPKHDTPVDPTHEKLLAVLSHAARLPATDEGGAAMAAADFPPASPGSTEMLHLLLFRPKVSFFLLQWSCPQKDLMYAIVVVLDEVQPETKPFLQPTTRAQTTRGRRSLVSLFFEHC